MENYKKSSRKKKTDLLFDILNELPTFYRDYILGVPEEIMATSTRLEYARNVRDFFEYLEKVNPYFKEKGKKNITISDLSKITKTDANEYAAHLSAYTFQRKLNGEEEHYSPKTVSRKLSAVSSMYKELMRLDKIKENPFTVIRRPKDKEHVIIHLTDTERKKLLDIAYQGTGLSEQALKFHDGLRDRAVLALLLDTGMRVSELVGLDMSDLDLEECSAIILRKGGKTEEVFFSDSTREILEEYIEYRNGTLKAYSTPALFISRRYERLGVRGIEYMVKKYAKIAVPIKADKISPHKLRSTFAMAFYEREPDLLLLKEIMGHSNIATTTIYANATKKRQREMRNILDE